MANDFKSYPNVIFEAWNEPAFTGYQNTVPSGFLNYLTTNVRCNSSNWSYKPDYDAMEYWLVTKHRWTLGWASQITTCNW